MWYSINKSSHKSKKTSFMLERVSKQKKNPKVQRPLDSLGLNPHQHVVRTEKILEEKIIREARTMENVAGREALFESIVANNLLERFEGDLEDADLSEESIAQIIDAAVHFQVYEIVQALAYPHDLRERFISVVIEQIQKGELKPEGVMSFLCERARRYGFGAGFHMSKVDIRPSAKGWAVLGTEQDHRDNDLPMAYYARSFRWLYRRGIQNYLYIVRAEKEHRVGDDGKWYRAPSLSIVTRLPVDVIRSEMARLDTLVAKGGAHSRARA